MKEFEGLTIETYEEQVFDTTKWRYASSALVGEMYYRFGTNWAREAVSRGFIPYYGLDTFVHWKFKRTPLITP
jgi:hypothetical protein